MKILFVDDEAAIREQAKVFLEDIFGVLDVTTIDSPIHALDILQDEYFSAVVSDYQMPIMDGLDFLKKLRKQGKNIPFIIFTGKGREEVAMQALNLGADGYVQKGTDVRSQYVLLAQTIKQAVERQEARLNLQRSEKEKSVILGSLSEHVVHIDDGGRIIWANRAAAISVNRKISDIIGEKCFEIWFDRRTHCESCPVLKAGKEARRCEDILESPDGRIWYVRGEPIKDTSESVVGLLEVKDDITEKTLIKKALEESEAKFRNLVDTAPSAVCILKKGRFRYVNHAMEVITGYSLDELLEMNFFELVSSSQRELVKERLLSIESGVNKTPSRYEINIENKDGDERWLYIATTKTIFESEKMVMLIGIDITEQKQLEDVLRGTS